ncbi:MAG: transposase [Balneolaceae bacterium]
MEFYPEELYHIYNRGNNRTPIFFDKKNYIFFLKKMKIHLSPYCHTLAWCLMPNHFHWLVKIKKESRMGDKSGKPSVNSEPVAELNKSIGVLLRSYTRAINKAYKRRGSLFQQKTNSKNLNTGITLDDNYALICFLYIHQNPVRAKLTNKLASWEFSSYKDYLGTRNGVLCNKEMAQELLDLPNTKDSFGRFSLQTLPEHFQDRIF